MDDILAGLPLISRVKRLAGLEFDVVADGDVDRIWRRIAAELSIDSFKHYHEIAGELFYKHTDCSDKPYARYEDFSLRQQFNQRGIDSDMVYCSWETNETLYKASVSILDKHWEELYYPMADEPILIDPKLNWWMVIKDEGWFHFGRPPSSRCPAPDA